MIKKLLKIIATTIINYRKRKDSNFIGKLLTNNKFRLLDIGGAGGPQKKWSLLTDNIQLIFVESHVESSEKLKREGHRVITKAAWSQKLNNLNFFNTKKPECSSLLEPNFEYLDFFPNSDRFKIINISQVETTTIDDEFNEKNFPHFIKIDSEGSEFEILKGGNRILENVLGLEVECSFHELRKNQAKFEDVKNFLEAKKIHFIDFLNLRRWERDDYRYTGQPQFFDALFIVTPETVVEKYRTKKIDKLILKYYITILFVFNRSDLLKTLIKLLNDKILSEFYLDEAYQLTKKRTKKINVIRKFNEIFMLFIREEN